MPQATRPFAFLIASILVAPALLSGARADEENGLRCSVAPAGDVDGDGIPDFALAERPSRNALLSEIVLGRVSIVSGKDRRLIRTLRAPRRSLDFGRFLESIGDLDADGVPELAIGGAEGVWVFSGRSGELLHDLGGPLAGLGLGSGISGGVDVDGDGVLDFGVYRAGAQDQRPAEQSVVILYSGKTGEILRVLATTAAKRWAELGELVRIEAGDLAPAFALLEDRDGDGRGEIALTLRPGPGLQELGTEQLVVINPWSGEVLHRYDPPDGQFRGIPWVLRVLPDVDEDGVPDLALSIIHTYVMVFSGGSGTELHRHSWLGGYLMAEGSSLEVAGDLDGDGVADYLVAANEDSFDCDPGMVTSYSGRSGVILERLTFQHGDCGTRGGIGGTACRPGADACAIGDVDGDGISEVAVHLPCLRQVRILSGASFEELSRIDTRTLAESPRESRPPSER